MTQSLKKQITDLKKRIEAAKGTPAEATFQEILADLEKQLQQEEPSKTRKTKAKIAKETTTQSPETATVEVAPVEKVTQETPTPEVSSSEETSGEKPEKEKKEKKAKREPSPYFFQAVGQLRTTIYRKEDKSGWYIEQAQTQYDLAIPKKLQYVIHFVEERELTLTVYPQVRYEKGDRDNCKIYFKLVGWSEERSPNEGLFILKGIWQFIPQYKRPVVSIYRNQRKWDGDRCKASHIPVLWKDSPLKPFKFNPKAETQGEKYFAQLHTKFIPRLNTFGVVEEIGESTLRVPKYIKPVKVDPTKADSIKEDTTAKGKGKGKGKAKTEGQTEVKAEVTTEVTTEVKAGVTTEAKTKAKTEVTTEVKAEAKTKAKTKAKKEVPPETTAEIKPEVAPEAPVEVKAQVTPEVTPDTTAETTAETKPKAKTTRTKAKTKK